MHCQTGISVSSLASVTMLDGNEILEGILRIAIWGDRDSVRPGC